MGVASHPSFAGGINILSKFFVHWIYVLTWWFSRKLICFHQSIHSLVKSGVITIYRRSRNFEA